MRQIKSKYKMSIGGRTYKLIVSSLRAEELYEIIAIQKDPPAPGKVKFFVPHAEIGDRKTDDIERTIEQHLHRALTTNGWHPTEEGENLL